MNPENLRENDTVASMFPAGLSGRTDFTCDCFSAWKNRVETLFLHVNKIWSNHGGINQSGGWQRLRRPRSKGDFENCNFWKKWYSSIVIRSKYALSDTGHIEAAGRSAGYPTKCVSSKNEYFYCEFEKKCDFLKIKKNATKSHICKVKSFQKW